MYILVMVFMLSILPQNHGRLPQYIVEGSPRVSPFYRDERQITLQVKNLIYQNEEAKAFEYLKKCY